MGQNGLWRFGGKVFILQTEKYDIFYLKTDKI